MKKHYTLLNYSASPVSISTRHESFLVRGGTMDSPGTLLLSLEEITVVNSSSPVFKHGILQFEPQYEAELYEELGIPNWQNLLTLARIEELVRNPTMENLQTIINIEENAQFERVRGVMVGLKSIGVDVSSKTEAVIEERRKEFLLRRRKSQIQLVPNASKQDSDAPSKEEFDAMKEQLAAMQKMFEQLTAATSVQVDTSATTADPDPSCCAEPAKPKATASKTAKSKTTNKK